jgi:predicted RNA-binding protein with PUA-like domain
MSAKGGGEAPMNWLVKEEPQSYSFETLVADGRTRWSGVRNPLAQKHLRSIAPGDRILYYHTGTVRAIVGTARAAVAAYPDPADKTGRLFAVDIVPVAPLARPVPLDAIRKIKVFSAHPLVRMPRLSVMPVSDAQWTAIERLARD